ncbi:MAG TPA: nuclear transport factor 2 family protein [Gemmatimonadales bacterium]|jgi:ketosteroid isomerase-like protein|nr:nuclear transport factor 2 family protein [Gemmatimonadales bacterium]
MSVRVFTAPPVLALALLLAACRPEPRADLVPVFTAQFHRSAADWNRGDLDGFMADYARDSLTGFVSAGRVERGYDWIRAHYAPRFREGARRDSLRFENVQARPLGRDFALVTARYVLARDGATVSSGPFTLVMQRQADGWKILHDHTSSDPR